MSKVRTVELHGGEVHVEFSVDDNLTDRLLKGGAKIDVVEVLQAVQASGVAYSAVTLVATYPLVDRFGNSSESRVVEATYSRTTVDRINWDGFLFDNAYAIADSVWIHPAFR